jgi:predicted phosphodiesterase
MINDIHGNNKLMESLLANTFPGKTDFVVFNGDMTNDLRSEEQLFGDFLDNAVKIFASETPMVYARGNHETRGSFAERFPRYFPTPTKQLYYLFRQGPVCLVVLDCGEDKPDSDIEYSGLAAFDNYRDKQALWLQNAVREDVFTKAPFRVVIIHMPPFGGWHGEKHVEQKFVPILNKAGIDLMLCGHLHHHILKQAGNVHHFPVIVNSNRSVVKVYTENAQLMVQVVDEDGKLVDSLKIPSRN